MHVPPAPQSELTQHPPPGAQAPLQARSPVGHWHAPPTQVCPLTEHSAVVQQLPTEMHRGPHVF